MSVVILPHKWRQQPAVPVGIDWGHPLARDMQLMAFSGMGRIRDYTGKNELVPTNAPSQSISRVGLQLTYVRASSQYVDCGNAAAVQITGPITTLSWYRLATTPGSDVGMSMLSKDNNTGGRAYTFDVINNSAGLSRSGVRLYVNGGGTVGTNEVAEARLPLAGDDRIAVGVYSQAANFAAIYIDGVAAATTTASTAIPSATTTARIGARSYSGFQDHFNGDIRLSMLWSRALSAAEIVALAENPWQVLQPLKRRIYVGPAASFNPAWARNANTVIQRVA